MYPDFATPQSAVGAFDLLWRHFHPQLSVDQVQPLTNVTATHSLFNQVWEECHSSLLVQVK